MYVSLSIYLNTCKGVTHTRIALHKHTHTSTDSQQAEIVTMTSALKNEIGADYSLSLDGAWLNFRDSFFYSLA